MENVSRCCVICSEDQTNFSSEAKIYTEYISLKRQAAANGIVVPAGVEYEAWSMNAEATIGR